MTAKPRSGFESFAANSNALAEVEEKLLKHFPQLSEMLSAESIEKLPRGRILCPRGHLIETVVLVPGEDNHFYLMPERETAGDRGITSAIHPRLSAGVSGDYVQIAPRVKLRCRKANCRYAGTKTLSELLKAVVAATILRGDTPDIHMTD